MTRRDLIRLAGTAAWAPMFAGALASGGCGGGGGASAPPPPPVGDGYAGADDELLDEIEAAAFLYYWEQTDPATGQIKDRCVSHGLALMYARPDASWSLESLAKAVGISRTAFADHFLRCTGMSPMQYLSQWRLRVAADSFAHSDRAIKTIAENAGFGSTAAFTRAFKREFGESPAKWRRGPNRETA